MRKLRGLALMLVFSLAIGVVAYTVRGINAAQAVLSGEMDLPVIIIDPGHGGVDGGATGPDDITEKDINLNICLVMRDIFTASGFEVIMTRDTDISIHDDGITSVRKQKTSDLHNRLDITKEHPNAVFISLHQNKFGEASSQGAQIFYSPNNSDSRVLADLIQKNMVSALQPDNKRQIKEAGKNLYLMYNAQCPSVLVECGFLSNYEEAVRLTKPEYQARIAFVTYSSVMEFLQLDEPVPEPDSGNDL